MTPNTVLSKHTIDIIKATVPLLQERGGEITTRFYEIMFTKYPELLNIFNHANQKKGRQPQALANAVYAAAVHIENLEAILPAVKQIAHKHRSLGVVKEQYPIVGSCLLQAIQEVANAPQEVLDAWAEAYGVLADAFISAEADMYKEAKERAWAGFRHFTVVKKIQESEVITSFYLQPADEKPLSGFKPGQYVTVKVSIPGEHYTLNRQYSLSGENGAPYYRISVKRESTEPAGLVSNYLHDHIGVGDTLELSAPAGDFILNEQSTLPVILISGGVGITPMLSMLHALKYTTREVYFIHGARNGRMHAFAEEVKSVKTDDMHIYTFYSAPEEKDRHNLAFNQEGLIDVEWLRSIIPTCEAEVYFCGPVPFMQHIKQAVTALGIAPENIHYEFFGPSVALE
ncbi:NO-inducible flavohemoprotein [Ectobacillus sp. JY-23]|uniref:NO-inducible flavohemoprotein n=1 Tax=Ectobacillus sp. JY-23 TaxID=2933872 RepID=UPI001FF55472|nr:NO-inducible flavohemoprotein [Ectobacillus sp. JY-23]UOY93532.1 NO-inducible flavohemoprotein [Ectobacillus sp. JY-23]